MAQFVRPTSDIARGFWLNTASGTTNLWADVDEVSASDADYIYSVNAAGTTIQFGCNAVTDPISATGHVIRVRAMRTGAPTGSQLTVELRQGATLIATLPAVDPANGVFTDYTYTLSAGEANSITDYTTLRLYVGCTPMNATNVKVSWVCFECPDAPQFVDPTGIATAGAFGTTSVQISSIDTTGIATAGAFGTAAVQISSVDVGGIASAEALGTPDAIGNRELVATGIASAEVIGTPVYEEGPNRVRDLTGIASAEAFGALTTEMFVLDAGGIASAESVSAPTEVAHVRVIYPAGIASGEAFGNATLDGGDLQFYGILDDFRQFVAPVTDDEYRERALQEMDPLDPSLAWYLQFPEGTGTTAFDQTGNGVDATLSSSSLWVGLDGGADLTGQRKKRVWGRRRMVEGTLVDSQRLVFQVNAGQTQSIVPLQGGFASLTSDGNFTNIYDWTPVAGHYATQLSEGLCRFQSDPTAGGTIVLAFDVQGDVDPVSGYTEVGPEIMRNMVRGAGLDDIDEQATQDAAVARPDTVGVIAGHDPVSLASLLNDIAGGHDGWWTFTRAGTFTQGVREEPGVPEVALTPDDVRVDAIQMLASARPVKRWHLSHRPYEVTMDLAKVSGSISAASRTQYTQEVRKASSRLSILADRRHADARTAEGTSYYDLEAAVRRELSRRIAIDELRHEIYRVPLQRGLFQHRIGQTVSLYLDDDQRPDLNLRRVALNIGRAGRGYLDLLPGGVVTVAAPPTVGTGSFTVEGWIRVDADSPGGAYRIIGRGAAAGQWRVELQSPSLLWGVVKFVAQSHLGGPPSSLTSTQAITQALGWTHFAVRVDRPNQKVAFFINGQLDSDQSFLVGATPNFDASGGALTIGPTLDGGLNDLRLWVGVARTNDEIAASYAEYVDLPGGSANWRLEGTAEDSVGPADGVLTQPGDWKKETEIYATRVFRVGGYEEDAASEQAELYLWGPAWEHEQENAL